MSKRTVNLELGLLKRILKWGGRRQMIGSSPLNDVPLLKEERKPVRRTLESWEVQRLLDASTQELRPLWATFAFSGTRRGEVVHLRWRDIDFASEVIHVRCREDWQTKTGQDRTIPISPLLMIEVRKLRLAASRNQEYVFLTERGTLRRNNLIRLLHRTAERAGLDREGLDLQCFRRTFATEGIRQGIPLQVLQRLLGHKTTTVLLEHYAAVFNRDTREGVGRITYGMGERPQKGPGPESVSQLLEDKQVG